MSTNKEPQKYEDDEIVITPKDIAALDFGLFDTTGIELPEGLDNPKAVLCRLDPLSSALPTVSRVVEAASCKPQVYPNSVHAEGSATGAPDGRAIDTARARQLSAVVARAYADVRCERSIDYIVAEPEANILFLQRCWELGAAASPFELNWVLMNARKAGRLEELDLSRAMRVAIPKDRLDRFSFAADMAMRGLLDHLYSEHRRDVSVDRILCDPHLVKGFDLLAGQLAPGFKSFEYRWAVVSMRKARRSKCTLATRPSFTDCGLVEDVRCTRLPDRGGIYWVTSEDNSLFMGAAASLRTQIDSLIGTVGKQVTPAWVQERPRSKPTIRFLECSLTESKRTQSALLRSSGSLLNFMPNDLMTGSAA